MIQPEEERHSQLISTYELMTRCFSADEIKTLYFYVGIDYDALTGEGKLAKARELIIFCERNNKLKKLSQVLKKLSPNVAWPEINSSR